MILCRRLVPLLVVALAIVVVPAPTAHAQVATVQMDMGDYWFGAPGTTAHRIEVAAGAVRFFFTNRSPERPHNFVIEGLNLRTPDVRPGQTFESTFNLTTPGTYTFICDLPGHAMRGMRGTLTVTGAQQPAAPGQQPAQPAQPATPPAVQPAQPAQPATPPAVQPASPGAIAGAPAPVGQAQPGVQAVTPAVPRSLPLLISLAIHIPAVIAWLGVVLYDAIIVAVPYLSTAQRGALLTRPRWIVLISFPLFVITGIYQTIDNPFGRVTDFASLEALRHNTTYGTALFWKHGFVLLSVVFTFAVTFWLGPRLVAAGESVAGDAPSRGRQAKLLAMANVAACLALLFCVAVMVFQLH